MLALYHYPLSPPAESARIVLDEKGLPYRKVPIDLPGRQNRTEAFLALNYRGLVPVLADGDRTICESNVIGEYLEDAYPEPRLLPTDPGARAQARQWIAVLQLDWHRLRQAVYHEGILKPLKLLPGPGDRQKLMDARKAMAPHLAALEACLERSAGDGPYLLGGYTLADALFTPTLYILDKAQVVPRTWPNVLRWTRACLDRPSAPRWLERQPGT